MDRSNRIISGLLAMVFCLSLPGKSSALGPPSCVEKMRRSIEQIERDQNGRRERSGSLLNDLRTLERQEKVLQLGYVEPLGSVKLTYDGPIRVAMGPKEFKIFSHADLLSTYPEIAKKISAENYVLIDPKNPGHPVFLSAHGEKVVLSHMNALLASIFDFPPAAEGWNIALRQLSAGIFVIEEMAGKEGVSYAVQGSEKEVAQNNARRVFPEELLRVRLNTLQKGETREDQVMLNGYLDSLGRFVHVGDFSQATTNVRRRAGRGHFFAFTLQAQATTSRSGDGLSGSLLDAGNVPLLVQNNFSRSIKELNRLQQAKSLESAKRLFPGSITNFKQISSAQDRAANTLRSLIVSLVKKSPSLPCVVALDTSICRDDMDKILFTEVVQRLQHFLNRNANVKVLSGNTEDLIHDVRGQLRSIVLVMANRKDIDFQKWQKVSGPAMVALMNDYSGRSDLGEIRAMDLVSLALRLAFCEPLEIQEYALLHVTGILSVRPLHKPHWSAAAETPEYSGDPAAEAL